MEEQDALTRWLPDGSTPVWVVIDAPMFVTLSRAQSDPARRLSRETEFHHAAHHRFRELAGLIPASATYDSSVRRAEDIAAAVEQLLMGW